MDPTTAVEQTAGARATFSALGHRAPFPKEARLLWHDLRGLAHDHFELAALETQRAGESLVAMVVAGMLVAGLLLSAWLALMSAAILALTSHGVMETGSALLVAGSRQFAGRARSLARDRPPESSFAVPRQCPQSATGVAGVPRWGDILMATKIPGPDTFPPSLTSQIGEAEHRLQNRRRLVRVRGATLNRKLRQWVTDPGVLLWVGGIGFLIGELTQRHTPKPQGPAPAPDAGHPFFEAARNLITLATLARPLFSALPGERTPPSSASDAPVQPSLVRSQAAPSAEAWEG